MHKLSEQETIELYKRCLKLVKQEEPEFFIFKKMRGTQGICDWESLEFDYRKEFVRTAFHECIHYIHQEWNESMVLYAESRVINVVTPFDVARFLKSLIDKVYKAELARNLHIKKEKRAKKSKPRKKINK
jgi:hypothetical protein